MSITAEPAIFTTDAGMPEAHARARLRQLVDSHYDFVWRSLRRLGVADAEAEDVAQEVFLTASRRLADIVVGKERGFLYRTAMNHAAHARRSRLRRREDSGLCAEEEPSAAPTPEELLDRTRARQVFYQMLERLSAEQREVFVLYELEQMTMAEVAETLNVPPGTVASRLRRARSAFSAALESGDTVSHEGSDE